jgi:hypothetical protein
MLAALANQFKSLRFVHVHHHIIKALMLQYSEKIVRLNLLTTCDMCPIIGVRGGRYY